MLNSNLFPIAKEGFNYIGTTILVVIITAILDLELITFFALVVLISFLFIYRNPERESIIFDTGSVTSPVDGVVTSIETLSNDPSYSHKIEIEGNYLNSSLLRVPFTSSLKSISLTRGAKVSKISNLYAKLNENVELIFEDEFKNKVKIIHTLKESFDSIKINIKKEQNLLQSLRYGSMINGITTIYFQNNFKLNVYITQELKASTTLLGHFTPQ